MSIDENVSNAPEAGQKRPNALELGPRKKAYVLARISPFPNVLTLFALDRCCTDPLVHHGRHFGRTVFALCNFQALLNNGIMRLVELPDKPLESFSPEFINPLFLF